MGIRPKWNLGIHPRNHPDSVSVGEIVNRDAQLALLDSRAQSYYEAALRSFDPDIIRGYQHEARSLLEHHRKMEADQEYELPSKVKRELGIV